MIAVATVQITGWKTGGPTGTQPIGPFQIFSDASTDAISTLTLASGDNTITVPSATAVGCVIVPPAVNTTGLTLKGVAGDTGLPIHPGLPYIHTFPAGIPSFILNAGASVPVEIVWF